MKKTSSMVYLPSHEARELYVYTSNNGRLADFINSLENSLRKKVNAGTYDSEKAISVFYDIACTGSKQYERDFGYKFDVTARYTAACDLREAFELDELEA